MDGLAIPVGNGDDDDGGDDNNDETAALFQRTVEFLLLHSGAVDKAVRYRCCQLLGYLTTEYTQRPDVSEDDLECFVNALLPRLRDKVCMMRTICTVLCRCPTRPLCRAESAVAYGRPLPRCFVSTERESGLVFSRNLRRTPRIKLCHR